MVTIIPGSPAQYIYTIKPGGIPLPGGGADCDYTSLNTWAAGTASNLVSQDRINIAEVMGTGNALTGTLSISSASWTTDATRYIEIRAASGHEHNGVYNESKAYAKTTNSNVFNSYNVTFHLNKMQMFNDGGSGSVIRPYCTTNPSNALTYIIDRCILLIDTSQAAGRLVEGNRSWGQWYAPYLRNSILLQTGTDTSNGCGGVFACGAKTGSGTVLNVQNCTIVIKSTASWYPSATTGVAASDLDVGGVVVENCYIHCANGYSYTPSGQEGWSGLSAPTKGSNDATSNTEATNVNLRNVAYSTANFLNVTSGSENLRPVVTAGNKLLDNGANLSGSGVTTDIIGTARPQFGAFDIGAFENDIPICWNYTARYKSSNKLFKASGCGPFPKSLQVPSNVDTSTGKMVDDGVFINPDKYKVI